MRLTDIKNSVLRVAVSWLTVPPIVLIFVLCMVGIVIVDAVTAALRIGLHTARREFPEVKIVMTEGYKRMIGR